MSLITVDTKTTLHSLSHPAVRHDASSCRLLLGRQRLNELLERDLAICVHAYIETSAVQSCRVASFEGYTLLTCG